MFTSSAKPITKKVGVTQMIDADGNVVEEKQNSMMLLGPPPDKCQVCASDHPHDQPHNAQSLYYQYAFYSERGRWPTWTDAMAHCTDEVKAEWRARLIEVYKERGVQKPAS